MIPWPLVACPLSLGPALAPIQETAPAPIEVSTAAVGGGTAADDTAPGASADAMPWTPREREMLKRIAELEAALRAEQSRNFQRQQEWIEYTRMLGAFELPNLPAPPDFVAEAIVPTPDPAAEALAREEERLTQRAAEIQRTLEALLIADEVDGIDFLEVGRLSQHMGRSVTGPVVARVLDPRGRMIGMLAADRLRVETSRAARTVTLVLEDGYESRGGVHMPFGAPTAGARAEGSANGPSAGSDVGSAESRPRGGVRRIFLGSIDPAPWIEGLPDLVDDESLVPVLDDGLWDLTTVRARMARLLTTAGNRGDARWRLVALGGIRDAKLRDLQLQELTSAVGGGKRLFADACRIVAIDGGGIELRFEGGSVRSGDRVAPFLDGRYRILLPHADADAWRAAELPGLGVPMALPEAEAPAAGEADTPGSGQGLR